MTAEDGKAMLLACRAMCPPIKSWPSDASYVQGFEAGLRHARSNPQPVEYSGIVGDDAEYFGAREA